MGTKKKKSPKPLIIDLIAGQHALKKKKSVLLTSILIGFDTHKEICTMQKMKLLAGSPVNGEGRQDKRQGHSWKVTPHLVLSALQGGDPRIMEAQRGTVSYLLHLLPGEVVQEGGTVPTVDTQVHLSCLFFLPLPLKTKE